MKNLFSFLLITISITLTACGGATPRSTAPDQVIMTRAEYDAFVAERDAARTRAEDADRRMAECVSGGDCRTSEAGASTDTSGGDTGTALASDRSTDGSVGTPPVASGGGVGGAPLMIPLDPTRVSETVAYSRGTVASMGYGDRSMGGMLMRVRVNTSRPFALQIDVPGFGPAYIDPGTSRPVVTGGGLTAIPMFPAGRYEREIVIETPGRRQFTVVFMNGLPGREAYAVETCSDTVEIGGGGRRAPYVINDSYCMMHGR